MSNNEKEKGQEEGLIDITEIVSDYFRILRRMWAWILILALVGMSLFYFRARAQYVPVYTASATFTINMQQGLSTSSSTFFDNSAAEQMATTFPYILTSGVLKRQVAKDMDIPAVTSSISASVVENTNLLTISCTDQDAGRAYATLQSVIKNYPSISEVIVGKVNMEMLDETGIPPYPDNPKEFGKSAVKGALLGVLLGAVWAALLVLTRRTIRKESDVHKWMNTRCLGSIPQISFKRRSKDVKVKLVLTEPKVEEKLQEPLRIIRNKIEYQAHEYGKKVFMLTSALAGEGKSTIAVNLALSLAQAGQRVVLIDCDLRHPSDREILGLEDGKGLGEILSGDGSIARCILGARDLGLDDEMQFRFIPGGASMADGSDLLGTEHMSAIITLMKKWADYVILDSAPAGLLTDSVVLAQYADAAIFVVRKDFAKIDYIIDAQEHLAESKIQVVGTILNGM
ncbi:MAG: polysaccharide biosynthesis tyrosine autokinase [Ruminococcus sp.]|nr:polysaccharide biosynthesis tyrosine autokinase [Ruminococcus sp.]